MDSLLLSSRIRVFDHLYHDLESDFDIGALIGRGAFGCVYRCTPRRKIVLRPNASGIDLQSLDAATSTGPFGRASLQHQKSWGLSRKPWSAARLSNRDSPDTDAVDAEVVAEKEDCRHLFPHKTYCVKIVPAKGKKKPTLLFGDDEYVLQQLNFMLTLKFLSPYIVKYYQFCLWNEKMFIVMEECRGPDLRILLERAGSPEKKVEKKPYSSPANVPGRYYGPGTPAGTAPPSSAIEHGDSDFALGMTSGDRVQPDSAKFNSSSSSMSSVNENEEYRRKLLFKATGGNATQSHSRSLSFFGRKRVHDDVYDGSSSAEGSLGQNIVSALISFFSFDSKSSNRSSSSPASSRENRRGSSHRDSSRTLRKKRTKSGSSLRSRGSSSRSRDRSRDEIGRDRDDVGSIGRDNIGVGRDDIDRKHTGHAQPTVLRSNSKVITTTVGGGTTTFPGSSDTGTRSEGGRGDAFNLASFRTTGKRSPPSRSPPSGCKSFLPTGKRFPPAEESQMEKGHMEKVIQTIDSEASLASEISQSRRGSKQGNFISINNRDFAPDGTAVSSPKRGLRGQALEVLGDLANGTPKTSDASPDIGNAQPSRGLDYELRARMGLPLSAPPSPPAGAGVSVTSVVQNGGGGNGSTRQQVPLGHGLSGQQAGLQHGLSGLPGVHSVSVNHTARPGLSGPSSMATPQVSGPSSMATPSAASGPGYLAPQATSGSTPEPFPITRGRPFGPYRHEKWELQDGPVINSDFLKRCIKMMALAVDAIHEHDFIHRDLKIENFRFRDSGLRQLVLLDFGLACMIRRDVDQGTGKVKTTIKDHYVGHMIDRDHVTRGSGLYPTGDGGTYKTGDGGKVSSPENKPPRPKNKPVKKELGPSAGQKIQEETRGPTPGVISTGGPALERRNDRNDHSNAYERDDHSDENRGSISTNTSIESKVNIVKVMSGDKLDISAISNRLTGVSIPSNSDIEDSLGGSVDRSTTGGIGAGRNNGAGADRGTTTTDRNNSAGRGKSRDTAENESNSPTRIRSPPRSPNSGCAERTSPSRDCNDSVDRHIAFARKNSKSLQSFDVRDMCHAYRMDQKYSQNPVLVGTMCNMAPEIYLHHVYSQLSDLWCLGTIFYELFCGNAPFEVGSLPMLQELHRDPVLWDAESEVIVLGRMKTEILYWREAGFDAQNLVQNLLRINPDDRLKSAKEILAHPYLKRKKVKKQRRDKPPNPTSGARVGTHSRDDRNSNRTPMQKLARFLARSFKNISMVVYRVLAFLFLSRLKGILRTIKKEGGEGTRNRSPKGHYSIFSHYYCGSYRSSSEDTLDNLHFVLSGV